MKKEIVIAGFGGQGVMSIGKSLVEAGLEEGLEVSWVPSYGPEMRGGTANCSVIMSDEPVGSPIVYHPTELIAMNGPSLKKFEDEVVPGGTVFLNSSIIKEKVDREDLRVIQVPCDTIANELGNGKVANMVMLGAVLEKTHIVSPDTALSCLRASFGEHKAHLIPVNAEALQKGAEAVR